MSEGTKTRVIKRGLPVQRPRLPFKLPVAALDLNADIGRLERAERELRELDIRNITDDKATGVDIQRMLLSQIRLCHLYATKKLRNNYLKIY